MRIRTKELGLAAYIKIMGHELVGYSDRHFEYESELSVEEWRIKYLNSCCYKHDQELCSLRKFIA